MTKSIIHSAYLSLCVLIVSSCSMTKNIPEGEQLFRGLTKIEYEDEPKDDTFAKHTATTKEEVEAALASAPNGSLFGSSYYSKPWSFRLWIYNIFSGKDTKFARWMMKSFGKPPVLMSQVNPALRASVAQSVLRSNGYFRSTVGYEPVPMRNPKKSKLSYTIRLDSLFRFDSIAYTNFPAPISQLIDSTREEAVITSGAPVSVTSLDEERNRLSTLFRNNGYYFYAPSYASYLADTLATPNHVQLQLRLADGLPDDALRQWYVGKVDVNFRKSMRATLTDSLQRRYLTIHYQGRKSPIRPRIVLKNLKLRPRQLFSYEKYQESASLINATGVFSGVDFQFLPRQQAESGQVPQSADTLDLRLNCTFNKPYDFYLETNLTGSTIGRYGPELKVGFTRLNAFRGAEKLDVNLHGSYEWQLREGADMSTYQYGADASIEFPRIIAPFYDSDRIRHDKNGRPRIHRRDYTYTPTTLAKVSMDIVRRPKYYKMQVISGEWTYRWQSSAQSSHEFSPFTLKYQYISNRTEQFDSFLIANPYLVASMEDFLIPKIRYTYTYKSPSSLRHPIRWETTVEESGNLISLWNSVIRGRSFNEKDKKLLFTPYSQFVRLETDLTKTWTLNTATQLVGHVNAGIIYAYGNSDYTPFSEVFYAGGANSVRAFSVRGIGPGSFNGTQLSRQWAYLMQNGDLKLIANLEYRTRLFGSLNGAVFLDAGNVWNLDEDFDSDELIEALFKDTAFRPSKLFDQLALGTGVGLRYDLGFLVIRLDWGIAIHMPYDTGKAGYFNVNRFRDAHTLHFAIGYPF